ncbi:hypothetical protein [Spirosoma aerophilum]
MPATPKAKVEPNEEPPVVVEQNVPEAAKSIPEVVSSPTSQPTTSNTPAKPERTRKAGFTVEDVINGSAREGDAFNKMVRVTDDHHELLRLLAFKYRKPMNVIVHNLITILDQVYQKEQKGGQSDV